MQSFTALRAKFHEILCKKIVAVNASLKIGI